MSKRIISFLMATVICFIHLPYEIIFAEELTKDQIQAVKSQYSATVSKYLLNRNTVEKVEDALLLIIAMYPDSDMTKNIEALKEDAENIYEKNKCRSVFSDLPEPANTMKILVEGGNQEDFLIGIEEKIKYLYSNYNSIEDDNALKYSSIIYIENYTKKLAEISSIKSEEVEEIYHQINNLDSEIMKQKELMNSDGATNLLVTKSNDDFAITQSGIGSTSIISNFIQELNGEFYFTSEMLIGKALSATYVPLRDNINDNPNIDVTGSENYKLFDSKYGDMRKAVYISTNNKAVSQYYVTGKLSSFKPALLRDFIENVDDEKFLISDPNYYNKAAFEKLRFPEKDERIEIKINKITDLNREISNDKKEETKEEKEILPSTEKDKEEIIEDTDEKHNSIAFLDTFFRPKEVYAAVSDLYSDDWKKAAKDAKKGNSFTLSSYYPSNYMPKQADLIDTIKRGKLLESYSGKKNINNYLEAASSNSNSAISYYIMHCIGWAMREDEKSYKSDEIVIPSVLYSENYFRDVMHYYIDKGNQDKFIDFCISQSILYKKSAFKETSVAVENLRNAVYSFPINQNDRELIFASFLHDLSAVSDIDVPDGKFDSFLYFVTGNNAWESGSGNTHYAIVDSDTVRWMYTTGTDGVLDKELYKLMNPIRISTQNKLNETGTIYEEVWEKILPDLIGLIDYKKNLKNKTDELRTNLGAWADVVVAVFSTGNIEDYGNAPDLTKDQRMELIKILPPSFQTSLNKYAEIQDAISKIPSDLEELTDALKEMTSGLNFKEHIKEKENISDNQKIEDDPILKRNSYLETISEKDIEDLSNNLSENNDINMFFQSWIEDDFTIKLNKTNQILILGSKGINEILNQEVIDTLSDVSYSVNKWYGIAFILDAFRNYKVGEIIAGSENKPIFRSSPNDFGGEYADSQFNYLLLKNIVETYPIRYDAVLDLDSPVFVDIYGNIVTESGLIVIPYAANATMHSNISLINSAFLSSYGKNEFIKINDKTQSAYIGKTYINLNKQSMNYTTDYPAFFGTEAKEVLISDIDRNIFILNPVSIVTDVGSVDLAKIDTVNMATAAVLYNLTLSIYTDNISDNTYSTKNAVINVEHDISNVLYQVLRGAELKNIDYIKENLNEGINFDKGILSQALKYERLIEQLSSVSDNSLITVPDLTNIDFVKYIVFFLYKILIIVFTFYSLIQVYIAASTQRLNIATALKIIIAFSCIGITIFSLPLVYKYSYYTTTRALLQNEASTIAMLNEEKRNNNVELGIVSVKNPDINSKLSLKVEDIDVNYASYISAMINAFDIKEMQDIYNREIEYTLETGINDYEIRGKALYHDVGDLFKSSQIYVDNNTHKLKQVVNGEPAISFRLPYYAILDYLIININQYNELIGTYDYGIQVMGDGRIRSIGLTDRYFKSNAFNLTRDEVINNVELYYDIDSSIKSFALYDKAGVFAIYGYTGYDSRNIFPNKKPLKNSQWFADKLIGDEEKIISLSEALDKEAILWVKKHQNVIGRISDETVLKALALDLSLKYNELLNVSGPQKIEIDRISTEDIIRLCTADTGLVLTSSPYSYAKFILFTAGLPGIYIGALITLVTFILGIVKPFVTIASFIVLIISLVVLRVLFGRKTANIRGFIKFIIILAFINISYAFILKIFMIIPSMIPCLVRLIFFLIIQMIYVALYLWITAVIIYNWKDMGNRAFTNVMQMKTMNIKVISDTKETFKNNAEESSSGWKIYQKLKESDKYRKESWSDKDIK